MSGVVVHYADWSALGEALVAVLVTEQDRARLTPSMVPRRRGEYLASRALLRHALERYTGKPGASFDVRVGADGKPRCVAGPAISLSHSGHVVVCAVGECEALGVDVEVRTPRVADLMEIAERFFTPAEARWIAADPETRFGTLWVLKEAYLKALGQGIAGGLATLECRIEPPLIVAQLAASRGDRMPSLAVWQGNACHLAVAALGAPAHETTVTRWAPGGEADAFGPFAPLASTSARPRSASRDRP